MFYLPNFMYNSLVEVNANNRMDKQKCRNNSLQTKFYSVRSESSIAVALIKPKISIFGLLVSKRNVSPINNDYHNASDK